LTTLRQLQPQSEETEAAFRQIVSLIHKIRQQEEVLRPRGGGRERRIWMGIIQYANADLSTEARAYASLFKVLYELTPSPELTEFKLTEFGEDDDFLYLSELSGTRKRDLISLAVYYQKSLKSLLLWLCWPKSHPELRFGSLRFLEVNAHGEDWHIDYNEDPVSDGGELDDEGKSPFLYFVKETKFVSVMGPICKFILEFVDDPPRPLPIRTCKRAGCDKLILPERMGRKEYCSPKCCALDHRPTSKENKDYMWLYRLSGIKSVGTLRKKLNEDPKAVKRLRQIEDHWGDQPKFTEKIKEIRKRVLR
jgi:hypothetical protein